MQQTADEASSFLREEDAESFGTGNFGQRSRCEKKRFAAIVFCKQGRKDV